MRLVNRCTYNIILVSPHIWEERSHTQNAVWLQYLTCRLTCLPVQIDPKALSTHSVIDYTPSICAISYCKDLGNRYTSLCSCKQIDRVGCSSVLEQWSIIYMVLGSILSIAPNSYIKLFLFLQCFFHNFCSKTILWAMKIEKIAT